MARRRLRGETKLLVLSGSWRLLGVLHKSEEFALHSYPKNMQNNCSISKLTHNFHMYRAIYITSECRPEENAIAHRQSYGVRMCKRTNMYRRVYLQRNYGGAREFFLKLKTFYLEINFLKPRILLNLVAITINSSTINLTSILTSNLTQTSFSFTVFASSRPYEGYCPLSPEYVTVCTYYVNNFFQQPYRAQLINRSLLLYLLKL